MASKRNTNRTALEAWIEAYLLKYQNTRNIRADQKYFKKAIALLNEVINGGPCCTGVSVDLITPYNNQLTNAIIQTLHLDSIVRRQYHLSLRRMVDDIAHVLYGCCCVDIPIVFDGNTGMTSSDSQWQIYDALTSDLIAETVIGGDANQTLCIPAKYFASPQVIICVNPVVPPEDGRTQCTYNLFDQNNNIILQVLPGVSTLVCTSAFNLVNGSSYILGQSCTSG